MEDNSVLTIVVTLVVAAGILLILYFSQRKTIRELRSEIELRAQQQYDNWRTKELEAIRSEQRDIALREANAHLQQWKFTSEAFFRSDAIDRSRAVIAGKVTEHLAPYLPDFKFNPKDARFVGSPIDLLVFDGIDEGELRNIYFVEVKTGSSATLSTRQRQIRDAILSGRVRWIELRLNSEAISL